MFENTTPIFQIKLSIFGKRVHFNLQHLGWTMEQRSISEYVGKKPMFDAITSYLKTLELVPAFNLADNQEYVNEAADTIAPAVTYLIEEIQRSMGHLESVYYHQLKRYGVVDDNVGTLFEVNNEYLNIRAEVLISADQK